MFKSICINNKSEYKQECLDLITFLDDWLYKKYFKEGCCIFEDELINNSNFNYYDVILNQLNYLNIFLFLSLFFLFFLFEL